LIMGKRKSLGAVAVAVAIFASCGGSRSSDNATETTTKRVKNAALDTTTTVAVTTTAPGPTTTGVVAVTTTTVAVAPTTAVAVPVQTKVSDPGNYSPTYLATTNSLGTPRPALPVEASLVSNASKTVSTTYRTDSSGTLNVASAEWMGATTPMTLRWNLTVGTKTIPCDNCAFVSTGVKKIIKAVLAAGLKGSGVSSVRGYDPSVTAIGSYMGNGWAAEFVVGDPVSVDAAATGNSIRDWALGCTGSTASTCRNVINGFGELRWKNEVWSTSDCVSALQNGGPKLLVSDLRSKLSGANTDTVALIRQRASLDRVTIAAPLYRPVFAASGNTRALTGFASTGCAQ
jgi:hypothetical protein